MGNNEIEGKRREEFQKEIRSRLSGLWRGCPDTNKK